MAKEPYSFVIFQEGVLAPTLDPRMHGSTRDVCVIFCLFLLFFLQNEAGEPNGHDNIGYSASTDDIHVAVTPTSGAVISEAIHVNSVFISFKVYLAHAYWLVLLALIHIN